MSIRLIDRNRYNLFFNQDAATVPSNGVFTLHTYPMRSVATVACPKGSRCSLAPLPATIERGDLRQPTVLAYTLQN